MAHGVDQDLTKAMEYFEKAGKINPKETMVIHNIALIHRINDNTDSALAYLKKAHGIDPDVFEIELLLGHLLFKQEKFDLAMNHLDAATRLKPSSGAAFRIKGKILLEKADAAGGGCPVQPGSSSSIPMTRKPCPAMPGPWPCKNGICPLP